MTAEHITLVTFGEGGEGEVEGEATGGTRMTGLLDQTIPAVRTAAAEWEAFRTAVSSSFIQEGKATFLHEPVHGAQTHEVPLKPVGEYRKEPVCSKL